MPDEKDVRWPRFEMVAFSAPTGIPNGWDTELLRKGVPKAELVYDAAKELMLLDDPEFGQFICFGSCGHDDYITQNPRTGAIVMLVYVPVDTANLAAGVIGPPIVVNSTLDQFIASVGAVVNSFPFDSGSTGWMQDRTGDKRASEWEHAAEDLFGMLGTIDPAAVADLDAFWVTFISEVQMGDYSTKMVLGSHREKTNKTAAP